MNIVISIGAKDTQRDMYPVQIQHEGKPLADDWIHIDRQALLEDEHKFSAYDYGMELCDALLTRKLDRTYQRLVGQAGAEAVIRVQLVIHPDAPELQALPWERLFHVFGNTETPISTDARTPFSRFLVSGVGDQPPVQEHPLRILVAVANPVDLPDGYAQLDVEGEVSSLADLLVNSAGRVQGTLLAGHRDLSQELQVRLAQQGWTLVEGGASWTAIQRHLPGHHMLHILAHGQFKAGATPGTGTAYLLLEDKSSDGSMERIPDDVIVTGLAGVHPLPYLVFLAACESAKRPELGTATTGANPFVGLAPKLVEAGVPAIVAMQDEVSVDLAHTLAADFYRRLFEHGQVDLALNEARSLVYKSGDFAWAIPVLFLGLQNGLLFTAIEPRKVFEPEMVFVRGGSFLMGSHPAVGVPEEETPQHSVALGDYYIGKYPVTNQEYAEFIKRVKTQDVPAQAGWFNRKPPPERLDHPVTGISWYDAVEYCAWLSHETGRRYRLPSEAEWEKAARGLKGQRYPWGETWDAARANLAGVGPTPVKAHSLGNSPCGCQDMIGNVEEWTRSLWGIQWHQPEFGYCYDANDGREMTTAGDLPAQGKVVHRGSSYKAQPGEAYCARRGCADPSSKIAWRGFRVVMEV